MALSDVILAATLNNQAELYKEEGRYADAEPLYERVLALTEKVRGPDHPSVALALNDLADLYKEQGRYVDAELLCKRALATWNKALGPDHPDVAQDHASSSPSPCESAGIAGHARARLDHRIPRHYRCISGPFRGSFPCSHAEGSLGNLTRPILGRSASPCRQGHNSESRTKRLYWAFEAASIFGRWPSWLYPM